MSNFSTGELVGLRVDMHTDDMWVSSTHCRKLTFDKGRAVRLSHTHTHVCVFVRLNQHFLILSCVFLQLSTSFCG